MPQKNIFPPCLLAQGGSKDFTLNFSLKEIIKAHESSILGKPELHEQLNIQVLPILFEDHQNDMDDMHKVVCIGSISVHNQDDIPQAKLPKII